MRIVESTSFEDDEDHITIKQALYIFDYNPNNTVKLSKKIENLKIVGVYKNYNNEIIIVQEKKVGILYIWEIYLRIKEFIYKFLKNSLL